MSSLTEATAASARDEPAPGRAWRPPSYWPFVLPALVVALAVIVFPWLFTIWMSFNEWKVGSPIAFVGLSNYLRLPNDPRFIEAIGHTLVESRRRWGIGLCWSGGTRLRQRRRLRL